MAAYVNRNDPRAKKTRKYLQRAFIELLSEKDFQMITINDISERAELNRATFYGHFQDKFELLDETLDVMLEESINKWIPYNPETDETVLVRNLMLAICHWHLETKKRINRRLTLSSSIEDHTKKKLYAIILNCLIGLEPTGHQVKRGIEIKATIISWSIYGIVLQWSEQVDSETAETLVDNALPLIMASVKAKSG
jgi:AcrR family transcriptional regulator